MTTVNRPLILLSVLFFLILALGLSPLLKNPDKEISVRDYLDNLGMSTTATEGFAIKEKFRPEYSDYTEENILAEKNGETIKITTVLDLDKDRAEKFSSQSFAIFESLFDPQLPPYPEFLTNKTGCDNKFLPVKKNVPGGKYYLTYAGERFNYGICSDNLIRYRAVYGIFYCDKNKKLFVIEYFGDPASETDELEKLIGSFRCISG